ncbi:MAG: aspartate/glutamate racemase family protein [Chloroflexi bacterium]|nr:aspartate/glutamate racemase family protein [Chloroflexota bacterium]
MQETLRLGLLIPPVNTVMEDDFNAWKPQGVCVHAHRLYRSRAVTTLNDLGEMAQHLEESVRLLAMARPALIIYGCTSGSLMGGVGWERGLEERIQKTTGVPAVTTATAVVEALRAMGMRRLAVATPYIDEINERERTFLEGHGFTVLSLESLGYAESYKIPSTDPETVYNLGRSADRPEADGLFISCTNFPTLEVIDRLEQALGKPVVTSNSTSLWACLRRLGVDTPVSNAGSLLRRPRVGVAV